MSVRSAAPVAERRDTPAPPPAAALEPAGVFGSFWTRLDRHITWVVLLGLCATAAFYLINLSRAPDFNIDETFYALAGQHVGVNNTVTFDVAPIRVHPPLFFIATGGWLWLTGQLHSSVLDAIHAGRFMNAGIDVALVGVLVLLARLWSRSRPPAARGRMTVAVLLLVALNPFLIRFGRLLLIEPMALLASLLSLLAAWGLRDARARTYITGVGATIGIALLVKEPALFLVGAPLVAGLLRRSGREMGRHCAALAVGAAIWSAFPLWELSNGDWKEYYFTQTFSIRRLLGLVQVSGLNKPGASPAKAFTDTLFQYSGAYLTFAAGGVVLAAAMWRLVTDRRHTLDEGTAQLLGLGLLSYGFLMYSVTVGQSNEQLTVYSVPAAALLVPNYAMVTRSIGRRRPRRSLLAPLLALTVVLGTALAAAGWTRYFLLARDDATARVETFISQTYAACVPVNATGDLFHWYATLRTNRVTGFADGPAALATGVHVFLVSPKDAEFHYGASSVELNDWISAHGRQVFSVPSHTNGNLSVWQVGTPVTAPGASLPSCVDPLPEASRMAPAPADRFLAIFAGLLGVDLIVGLLGLRTWRRRGHGDGL